MFVCCLLYSYIFGCVIHSDDNLQVIHVLYSTDLSVDGDFDDYFDLAALYALSGSLEPTIIVDGNNSGLKQTGVAAIRRLAETVGWAGVTDTVIVGRR